MRTKGVAALALSIVLLLGLSALTWYSNQQQIKNTIIVKISNEALRSLGLDSYTVNYATLYIPGSIIKLPKKVIINKNKDLEIIFDNITKYANSIRDNMQPVISINLIDYNTNKSYSVILSSKSLYIVHEVKDSLNSYNNIMQILNSSIEKTKKNPLYLLENNIYLDKDDILILEKFGYIYKYNLTKINHKIFEIVKKELNIKISCDPPDEEYGRPGSGIYRKIDYNKYYELYNVPDWWYARYKERDYRDNATDDYHRLVKDVFASIYYIDKTKYQDINYAIENLTQIIYDSHITHNSGVRVIGTTGIMGVDGFIGVDEWNDTVETGGLYSPPRELALFKYKFNSSISVSDGGLLHVEADLYLSQVSGAVSGLMFGGIPLTYSDPINIEIKNIHLSSDLNNNYRKYGEIVLTNYTVTLGPDSIIIRWLINKNICQNYYVAIPVAIISPLFSIDYSIDNIVGRYSSDGDLLGGFNSAAMSVRSMEWIEDRGVPIGNDEILFNFTSNASNGVINVGYNSLIDIPPITTEIINMMLGNSESPIAEAVLKVYNTLASINVINANVSAVAAYFRFEFTQQGVLSRDVYIHMLLYNSTARALLDPVSRVYNAVEISVSYNPPPPPPCGPYACPVGGP